MAGELLLGCSGWNYADTADKGGWTGVFYPDSNTKRLRYYSQFFNTAEMDSTFYQKFYTNMTRGTFIGGGKNKLASMMMMAIYNYHQRYFATLL
jgi:hypothetical protein